MDDRQGDGGKTAQVSTGGGLLVERGRVTRITFNRPQQRNALGYEDWYDLGKLLPEIVADEKVQMVVFTGAGDQAFSAGGDISQFPTWRMGSRHGQQYQAVVERALNAILASRKPMVAHINGVCTGGGLQVATCCDIRVAVDDARFGMPIARLGVAVGWQELERLVAVVGYSLAADLLLSGRLLTAAEALQAGLVSRVVPRENLDDLLAETVGNVLAGSPLIHQIHKEMLALLPRYPALRGLPGRARQLPLEALDSDDYAEGVEAFLAGRKPQFKGE